MNKNIREFNCKNEELPVICRLAATSLKRDQATYEEYSPKFNSTYTTDFEAKTFAVEELLSPKTETVQLKIINDRLHLTTLNLSELTNRLSGYVDMAYPSIKMSQADFDIINLRKGINAFDTEKVVKNLKNVITNANNNKEALEAQGLKETLITELTSASETIMADKVKKYEILNNRKTIVENNMVLLNDLNSNLVEILKIGKILFKNSAPLKLSEYTFSELKKQVHRTRNSNNTDEENNSDAETPAAEA